MSDQHTGVPDPFTPQELEALEAVLERSRSAGFLGDGPVRDHIDHALGFTDAIGVEPRRFLDLGSGGGVPGLVLAMAWPKADVTLLDAQQKRCAILEDAVAILGVGGRVAVARGRAEELGRDPTFRGQFDLVTSRSFGPPAVVAECAAPFLASGGALAVSEPPGESDRWPADQLVELGLRPEPRIAPRRGRGRIQVVRQVSPLPDRYPRRVGIPTKRPLF
jgi:16S rRNA (guanine527-N7)-methyltransferase